jgi:hypothetical protein
MKLCTFILILTASVGWAEDLYVTPQGAGNRDGSSWSNAFASFAGVAWGKEVGKVGAGDTLWVAGGTYATTLVVGASGTALNRIAIRRVKTGDVAPSAAAGWSPALDAPVIIDGPTTSCILLGSGNGDYVTIDGREEYGIKCVFKDGGRGVEIDNTPGIISGIVLQYIEAAGPGPITQSSDTRGFDLTVTGTIADLRVSHCSAHHCDTTFQISESRGLIVEYSRFYDAYALNADVYHPNTMLLTDCTNGTIRFNRFYHIRVEGLFFESGTSDNVRIYGNLFYVGDISPDNGRGIEFGNTAIATNIQIYNNTFAGLPFLALRLSENSRTGMVVKNNIFFKTVPELEGITHDYNLFSGELPAPEPNGVANAPDPFVNLAQGDFHLSTTVTPNRARNSGQALGPIFDVDPEGNLRGADGSWDIGAYELGSASGAPSVTSARQAGGIYGSTLTYQITGSNTPTAYSLFGTLPPGLAYNAETQTISGTASRSGIYETTIVATNANGSGATILTLDLKRAEVTVAGTAAENRVYNGTRTATLNTTASTLVGLLPSDAGKVTLVTASAVGSFASAGVGQNKPVTIAGLDLAGSSAANYRLLAPDAVATITRAPLTVDGITATNRTFDGTINAAVSVANAKTRGLLPGDSINFVSASGRFLEPGAGNAKPLEITEVILSGSSSANYFPVPSPVTAHILPASATLTLSNLLHSFDATAKSINVTTVPAGLSTAITYSGNASPPSAVGLYAIIATITDPNYRGSATGVLNISSSTPPLPAFTNTGFAAGTVGVPFTFLISAINSPTAYAATGLPAGLNLNTATGVISGTPTTVGTTVTEISASNGGGVARFTLSITIVPVGSSTQTVSFSVPTGPLIVGKPFPLVASASSGLAVTFSIVSGNAVLSGHTLTLYDTGRTVVRATQPGNTSFVRASAEVAIENAETLTSSQVFFGQLGTDPMAAVLAGDNRSGTIYARVAATGETLLARLLINGDGTFNATMPASTTTVPAAANRTLRGRSWNGLLIGTVTEISAGFSAVVQPPSGSTLALAGAYTATVTPSASGATYLVVGTQGQAYALSITPALNTSAHGMVDASGRFTFRTSESATITGTASAASQLVQGTLETAAGTTTHFAGSSNLSPQFARLANLSSLARVSTDDGAQTMVAGLALRGTSPRPLLLRAVGPGLTGFGVASALPNPKLRLFDQTRRLIGENDDWINSETASSTAARVGAFPLLPGSRDAVIQTTLAAGTYTIQVDSFGESGAALVEVYDTSEGPAGDPPMIVNLSTRGFVGGAGSSVVSGIVIAGTVPARVLVRGVGAALASFGIDRPLADPLLQIYRGSTLLAQNDNWESPQPITSTQSAATALEITAAAAAVGAFALPTGGKDAALIVALNPGAYSAVLSGAGNTAGAGLVEVYFLASR